MLFRSLIVAFIFVSIAGITGNSTYDALGSISIGFILITISIFCGWRIKELIIGRSAEPELTGLIDSIIRKDNSIEKLLHTITIQFGPDIMLAAKLKMKPGLTIEETVKEINELEDEIQKRVPAVKWCFIEPDIKV